MNEFPIPHPDVLTTWLAVAFVAIPLVCFVIQIVVMLIDGAPRPHPSGRSTEHQKGGQ